MRPICSSRPPTFWISPMVEFMFTMDLVAVNSSTNCMSMTRSWILWSVKAFLLSLWKSKSNFWGSAIGVKLATKILTQQILCLRKGWSVSIIDLLLASWSNQKQMPLKLWMCTIKLAITRKNLRLIRQQITQPMIQIIKPPIRQQTRRITKQTTNQTTKLATKQITKQIIKLYHRSHSPPNPKFLKIIHYLQKPQFSSSTKNWQS